MSKCYMKEAVDMTDAGPAAAFKPVMEGMSFYTEKIRAAINGHPTADLPLVVISLKKLTKFLEAQMGPKEEILVGMLDAVTESQGMVIQVPGEEEE